MRASSQWRVAQLALNCRQSPQAAMNQRSRPVVAYGLPLDQLENLLSEGQALAEDRQRALTTLTRHPTPPRPAPAARVGSQTGDRGSRLGRPVRGTSLGEKKKE